MCIRDRQISSQYPGVVEWMRQPILIKLPSIFLRQVFVFLLCGGQNSAYSVFSARVVGKTSGHQRLVNFLERHSTSFCPRPLEVERRFRPTSDYVIGTRYQAQYTATADHPLSIFLSLQSFELPSACLLYTSDAADDLLCVDLGGRRIIKKKKK